MSTRLVYSFLLISPLLLVSLVLHELAHGWVAWKLGDPTAKLHGRLTLNPLKHLDPWGTALLAVTFFGSGGRFFFGWAKPVPISPWHFKDPQRGMMLVGLAGPVVNYSLALVSAGLIWLVVDRSAFVTEALYFLFALNVILGTLNLIPIPPLDGSRVLGGFLPREAYKRWITYDRYGNYVFLGLFVVLVSFPALFDATFGAVLRLWMHLLPEVVRLWANASM